MSNRIKRLLIANRGEIALRVIRTCRELGIHSIAVYAEGDGAGLHVRLADEAVCIGPADPALSYRNIERLLEACRHTEADAVHPGYGFLSENAAFARAVRDAGIIWIGPPPEAIAAMGDKTAARQIAMEAGVPLPPGSANAIDNEQEAEALAASIGYPVLIKAAAGGGGKGMRIAEGPADFHHQFQAARSEAASVFGDARVFVEKYLLKPRHIEIQVLFDAHGNGVYLFERECSIQRRHQKVVEEAPSPAVGPELRRQMGEAALNLAARCGYVNAGTVEFLLDGTGAFYFLEMNTRLQVEHPITEWITGLDLVAEQIHIAEGGRLNWQQEDLRIHGHAMECRIYAEDPLQGFLPDTGLLVRHAAPGGPGVRIDTAVEQGMEVTIHYDPMIAKLSTWGPDRETARRRMDRALAEYDVAGVQTTIGFCRFVMEHEAFRSGHYDTGFVGRYWRAELAPEPHHDELAAVVGALLHPEPRPILAAQPLEAGNGWSPWVLNRRRLR